MEAVIIVLIIFVIFGAVMKLVKKKIYRFEGGKGFPYSRNRRRRKKCR